MDVTLVASAGDEAAEDNQQQQGYLIRLDH
jgi:hypothetical protein